ncbi:MAG: hypothetical protein IKU54_03900 [Oscillospiraceae bacterium]|nr:hypothetical protein [Oscillospiraceae bacterium]
MSDENHKYNDNIARYVAALIVQNRYNHNSGMTYRQAVKKYSRVKRSIDYWLEKTDQKSDRGKV